MVAAYTTYDAWGIRATADPFTCLAWCFMLDGIFIPALMARRLTALTRAQAIPLFKRGLVGAFVADFSVGSIMRASCTISGK